MQKCLRHEIKFQSTPDLINRENAKQAEQAIRAAVFQSTPDLINRENAIGLPLRKNSECFNPLPI